MNPHAEVIKSVPTQKARATAVLRRLTALTAFPFGWIWVNDRGE